jgi:hypothetical protein
VQLRPSRLPALFLVAVHLAAVLPAAILAITPSSASAWLVAVVCSLFWHLRRPRVLAIRQLSGGRWRLSLTTGEWDGELISWYAHPWLCVAVFRSERRRRRAVVVPYWRAGADVHRRLRVALRTAQLPERRPLSTRLKAGRDLRDQ